MYSATRVSICVPTYNGGQLVCRAIDSALEQDYANYEIIVVDDHSTDGTPELIRNRYGGRITLKVNRSRIGLCANHDATVLASTGELIKFLHQDDVLSPRCVSTMAEVLQTYPAAGLVFCRRSVELGTDDLAARTWKQSFANLHEGFSNLSVINDGPALFREWLGEGLPPGLPPRNWIGEPVAVMVTRSALATVGLFNRYTRLAMDIDLWARIMAQHPVGFVDEALVTFRHSATSTTGLSLTRNDWWLDRLWLLEALTSYKQLAQRHSELVCMRDEERRITFRTVVRRYLGMPANDVPTKMWWRHAAYRFRGRLWRGGQAPFERLPPR